MAGIEKALIMLHKGLMADGIDKYRNKVYINCVTRNNILIKIARGAFAEIESVMDSNPHNLIRIIPAKGSRILFPRAMSQVRA